MEALTSDLLSAGREALARGQWEAARTLLEELLEDQQSPEALESLFERAGLGTKQAGYLEGTFDFPDEATLLGATLVSGPAALAIHTSGEEAVGDAVRAAFAGFSTAVGGFRIETEWRYVTGIA